MLHQIAMPAPARFATSTDAGLRGGGAGDAAPAGAALHHPAEVFLLVGLLYFILCSALEQCALRVGRYYQPAGQIGTR